MAHDTRRRNVIIAIIVIVIILVLLLLRCQGTKPVHPVAPPPAPAANPQSTGTGAPSGTQSAEVLTPAIVTVPERITAGAAFVATWTGPDNQNDFLTIVRADASTATFGNTRETRFGKSLELTAPIDAGPCEVRYVTGRSHTILGRAAIEVFTATATLDGPAEVGLGTSFSLSWSGPNNKGDFVTIVPKDALDSQYGSFVETEKGSPQTLTAPTTPGEAELRYVARQGNRVIARRPIKILSAAVTIIAPDAAAAGSTVEVTWTGPSNPGDFITVVAKSLPDGQYGNRTLTAKGSPLALVMPVAPGAAELRYMTGQGGRVLARRDINLTEPQVTITALESTIAGASIDVTWTGPNNTGDFITIVSADTPDGRYGNQTKTSTGSPLKLLTPIMEGNAELRYMTGQGGRILARRAIKIIAAEVTLSAPAECKPASDVSITWTGPNNAGDFITIVPKSTRDGQYGASTLTAKGSPMIVKSPKDPGDAEVRYMSGQGGKVLKRVPIKVVP